MTFASLAAACSSSSAAVLITQYYEGTSNNKWIEITNTGASSVDLATGNYKLSLWTNANAEAYKADGTPSQSLVLTGTIAAGASFLYSHNLATLPTYATATVTSGTVINFNGNDSVTLWTGTTFSTASIIDAIGFTNLGNEGADKSLVRASATAGWNTTAGSEGTDFPTVWTIVTNAAVDSAETGTDNRLGFSSVAVPEPTTALLSGLGILALLRRRR